MNNEKYSTAIEYREALEKVMKISLITDETKRDLQVVLDEVNLRIQRIVDNAPYGVM